MPSQVTSLFKRPGRRAFLAGTAAIAVTGIVALFRPGFIQQANAQGYDIMQAKTAFEAAKNGEIILVDIRTPQEWQETGIGEGAIALDMRDQSFVASLVELRQQYPQKPIALICRSGNRSNYVVNALVDQKFTDLVDVSEGMLGGRAGSGWVSHGLPVYPGTKVEITQRLLAARKP